MIGRSFKVSNAKKNYIIRDILFNPKNQEFLYNGKSTNLIKYYEIAHGLKIKDILQPLIAATKKGPQDEKINLYFIQELCFLSGLEDESVKDGYFMRELDNYTKLEPDDRIKKTNQFLNLL